MELKAPAPLGEGQKDNGKYDDVLNQNETINYPIKKERKISLLSFILPNIKLPPIKLPDIDIPKEKKKLIINISLVAVPGLLLLLFSILITSFVRSEPYRMADEFLEKIEIRDINGAYSLTTDAYKVVVTKKDFDKLTDQLNSVDISNLKVKSKKIEEVSGMGKYAYIKYKISGCYVDIIVFNDQTDWGIHSVKLSVIENN